MKNIETIEKEIRAAQKRENPNWDGKSFDYGCSIYEIALESYKTIYPIIEKAGFSGYAYGLYTGLMARLLKDQPINPITDDDFVGGVGMPYDEKNKIQTYQCGKYSSIFKEVKDDGSITYHDINRCTVIDYNDTSWHSGYVERLCKDYIPEIKMPYLPTDKPIKIYVWDFSSAQSKKAMDLITNNSSTRLLYSDRKHKMWVELGSYNSVFIRHIVFPNGDIVNVNKLYLYESYTPTKCSKRYYKALEDCMMKAATLYKSGEK